MAEGYIAKNGITVSAAWTATKTNANNVRVTDIMTIPEKGVWLILIGIPIVDREDIIFGLHGSISNIPSSSAFYFPCKNQAKYCVLINVSADNTEIYLITAASAETNYSYINRGYISAVKMA